MKKRFVTALVVAMILGSVSISRSQIFCTIPCPIWDPASIAQHAIITAITETINTILGDQAEEVYKWSRRLSTWLPMAKYSIDALDQPDWRLHSFWDASVIFSKEYFRVLTYGGDASGVVGILPISVPRVNPDSVLMKLSPDASESLRADLATIDAADSTLILTSNMAGLLRYNGRSFGQANNDLQEDVLNESMDESATAVLDRIAAEQMIGARSKQTKIQMLAGLVELGVVDSKRERDRDVNQMNMMLRRMDKITDGEEGADSSMVTNATSVIRGWRIQ